jgi:hypothetical protein
MTLQEFRNILAENQSIVIAICVGFVFLIMLIYLFLRTIFSTDAADEIENAYRKDFNSNFPNEIDDEDLGNYVIKLKHIVIEGQGITEKLENQIIEKQKDEKAMLSRIEQLKEQQEVLEKALADENITPVPLLNEKILTDLRKKAKRKANFMLFVGLLLGLLVGVVALTGYAHFILKVSLFKVWW